MSTLLEIEAAARKLPADQKQQLLLLVARILRDEGQPLPEPRRFSAADMQSWLDEDQRDMERLRGGA